MLPSERNERWVMRIGIAILIFFVLFIAIWIFRFVRKNITSYLKPRNVPTEEGRAPSTKADLRPAQLPTELS